ncbi:MAG: cadherin repeat domain-containing protein [Verrucomicrobiae bacterium]|nr:cadherin repeat domain-containing protein [Verrucomicrobiae bacterium]
MVKGIFYTALLGLSWGFLAGNRLRADELLSIAGDPNNPLVSRAGSEARQATMVIDEGHPFDLSQAPDGVGVLTQFRFFVKQATGRVTPFVARRLGDNAFSVMAIGKTRVVGVDFTREDVGTMVGFPFSDEPVALRVDDGWVAGFLSANADGSDSGRSPVPFEVTGNEVWTTGGQNIGDSGSIRLNAAPTRGAQTDLEKISTYAFQITAVESVTDPVPPIGLETESEFIPASAVTGTAVATLLAVDPNPGDELTFRLVEGEGSADNELFRIEGTMLVTVDDLPGQVRDYQIHVEVVDSGGLKVDAALTLRARLPMPPGRITLDSLEIPLGTTSGRRIGCLSAEDPNVQDFGDWHTFQFAAGDGDADNGSFSIHDDKLFWIGGNVEPGEDFSIRIRATDRTGLSLEQTFEISGQELDRSLIGNAVTGRKTSRADVTPAFYTNFAAMPSDGVVDAVEIYFQGQASSRIFHMLQLRADVSGGYRVVYDSGATVPRGVQDEPVRIPFSNGPTTVKKGDIFAHYGTGIPLNIEGVLSDTGGDQFFPVFVPLEQPEVGDRIVFPGALFVNTGGPQRDYAWAVHFSPTVPLAPVGIALSSVAVAAGATEGTRVAALSALDPNPDRAHSFSLVSGAGDEDNVRFQIDGATLKLASAAPEAAAELGLRIQATDSDGLRWTQAFRISVLETAAPTAIRTDEPVLFSGIPVGVSFARLLATDPGIAHGERHAFQLIGGYGDDDNGLLVINGDSLSLSEVLASEQSTLRFRVRATNESGLNFERSVILPVTQMLGNVLESRTTGGEERGDAFYTNFLEVPEPGTAYGISRWQQASAGEFSIVQIRVTASSDNIYNVIHSSGTIEVAGNAASGIAHEFFLSGPSRVEPGDLFGSYGNGLAFSETDSAKGSFVPVYWARLRPTRPNIITLGSPAFRVSPRNSRDYAWAVQWLPDSRRNPDPDQDGDGLPDAWEMETFGQLSENAFGDRDGDGLSNLLEFYANSNPLALSLAELPEVVPLADNQIRVSYQASDLPEIEKRYFAEWSPDLEAWEKMNGVTTLDAPLGDGSRMVRTVFSPPAAGHDGGYVRLRAVP